MQSDPSIAVAAEGADGKDMKGKVVAITGANSGVGKEVATYCAAKQAKVYMLCRSKERAEAARDEIIAKTGNKNVEVLLIDVSLMEKVREAASQLKRKEPKIHALVCNAGVLLNERKESKEGFELTFASHLLGGTYLLSMLLKDNIRAAEEGRVVIVSSAGAYNYKVPEWKTLTSGEGIKYNGQDAYAYAKRAQIILAEQWAKEYPEITWVTSHPGWAATPAVDEAYGDMKKYLEPMRTPWQGAEGIAWLVAAPKANLTSGAFYLDRIPQTKHLAGPFFTEGSSTKNKKEEIDQLLKDLKKAAGL